MKIMFNEIENIPWSRIVHFYGRATEYPKHFNYILNGSVKEQEKSFSYINSTIEHQDGIIYATPFVVKFIIDFLKFEQTNKIELLKIIYNVLKSVNFQLQLFEKDPKPIVSIEDLLNEKFLWKEYESEINDEILWEEWDYGEEYLKWITLTGKLIKDSKVLIEKLRFTNNNFGIKLKNNIINEINKSSQYLV